MRDVSGSFHLPTAIFVAGAMVLLYALVRLVRHGRSASQGFVSEVDHATHATLHTASLAARHLQDGLTAEGTAKAAKHLRELLGSAGRGRLRRRRAAGLGRRAGAPRRRRARARGGGAAHRAHHRAARRPGPVR